MSPMLKSVEAAGKAGMMRKRNPATISSDDFYSETELLRQEFGKLIHAQANRIVVIPSVSYGLATVARNIKISKGNKIIVAAEQFPSNYYPWQVLANENQAKIEMIAPPQELVSRGKH